MRALDELGERFWAWRACQQPRTRDDIPRLDRPPGWLPEVDAGLAGRRRDELGAFEAELARIRAGRGARPRRPPAAAFGDGPGEVGERHPPGAGHPPVLDRPGARAGVRRSAAARCRRGPGRGGDAAAPGRPGHALARGGRAGQSRAGVRQAGRGRARWRRRAYRRLHRCPDQDRSVRRGRARLGRSGGGRRPGAVRLGARGPPCGPPARRPGRAGDVRVVPARGRLRSADRRGDRGHRAPRVRARRLARAAARHPQPGRARAAASRRRGRAGPRAGARRGGGARSSTPAGAC